MKPSESEEQSKGLVFIITKRFPPPGMGFRIEIFLLQGDLSDPGIEPGSPALQADSLPSEPPGKPI